MPALLAGLTNAGHPYQCGCLALGTRIGARVAFQGRMIVDPRLGTNHAAEVGAGPDRPVMRACRSGSERSDWKERNQSRRAIGIVPDHSSRTCSDLAIPSVQIIAETGFTYTGLVSSFAGSGHTVLDSPTAQSLTPGDFLDAIASADLVEPDQLASMNRRGNLGPGCGRGRFMSPAWPLSVPADSLHFATVLIVLAISVDPQPPGLGRILFSECATFCYFVLAISPSLTGISAHRHLSSGFEKNGEFLFGAMEKCDLGEFVYQNKEQRAEIRLETRRFLGRRPEFLAVCRVVENFGDLERFRCVGAATVFSRASY